MRVSKFISEGIWESIITNFDHFISDYISSVRIKFLLILFI